MAQEFHVVRCFSCETFQVQQVKKVNKWSCKVCGQNQSVIKEFGRGSGADCRRHVQKLNAARGAKIEEQDAAKRDKMEAQSFWELTEFHEEHLQHKPVSRWDKYLSAQQEEKELKHEEVEAEEAVVMDRDQVNVRKPRPNRSKPYNTVSSVSTKKRITEKQDVSRPHSSSSIPTSPSIPSVIPVGAVSKWNTFLENPRVREPGSGFSRSSLFQTGDDLDLSLDWD